MRFSAASIALFAGAALAIPHYEQPYEQPGHTIYSTREVTITSCGPEVTDCPGKHTSAPAPEQPIPTEVSTRQITVTSCGPEVSDCPGKPVPTPSGSGVEPTQWSTRMVTITDCPPEVTDCPARSTHIKTSVVPVPTGGSEAPIPSEIPPYPTGPKPSGPSTSIVTYTTCVPSETTSVVTLWPSVTRQPSAGVPKPSGGSPNVPSVSGVPSGTGAPPKPTGTSPPIFEGAASTVGGSVAAAGLAAIVALFL